MSDQLFNCSNFAAAVLGIWVSEKQIGRKRNLVLEFPAEYVVNRNTPFFSNDIETCELESSQYLSSIVVKRCRRISDLKSHFLKVHWIVPYEITFHRAENGLGRLASSAH